MVLVGLVYQACHLRPHPRQAGLLGLQLVRQAPAALVGVVGVPTPVEGWRVAWVVLEVVMQRAVAAQSLGALASEAEATGCS